MIRRRPFYSRNGKDNREEWTFVNLADRITINYDETLDGSVIGDLVDNSFDSEEMNIFFSSDGPEETTPGLENGYKLKKVMVDISKDVGPEETPSLKNGYKLKKVRVDIRKYAGPEETTGLGNGYKTKKVRVDIRKDAKIEVSQADSKTLEPYTVRERLDKGSYPNPEQNIFVNKTEREGQNIKIPSEYVDYVDKEWWSIFEDLVDSCDSDMEIASETSEQFPKDDSETIPALELFQADSNFLEPCTEDDPFTVKKKVDKDKRSTVNDTETKTNNSKILLELEVDLTLTPPKRLDSNNLLHSVENEDGSDLDILVESCDSDQMETTLEISGQHPADVSDLTSDTEGDVNLNTIQERSLKEQFLTAEDEEEMLDNHFNTSSRLGKYERYPAIRTIQKSSSTVGCLPSGSLGIQELKSNKISEGSSSLLPAKIHTDPRTIRKSDCYSVKKPIQKISSPIYCPPSRLKTRRMKGMPNIGIQGFEPTLFSASSISIKILPVPDSTRRPSSTYSNIPNIVNRKNIEENITGSLHETGNDRKGRVVEDLLKQLSRKNGEIRQLKKLIRKSKKIFEHVNDETDIQTADVITIE